jgi:hypothetical protein
MAIKSSHLPSVVILVTSLAEVYHVKVHSNYTVSYPLVTVVETSNPTIILMTYQEIRMKNVMCPFFQQVYL